MVRDLVWALKYYCEHTNSKVSEETLLSEFEAIIAVVKEQAYDSLLDLIEAPRNWEKVQDACSRIEEVAEEIGLNEGFEENASTLNRAVADIREATVDLP